MCRGLACRAVRHFANMWGATFVYTPQFIQGTCGTYRSKMYDLERPLESYAETLMDYYHARTDRRAPQWSMGWWGGEDDIGNQIELMKHFNADSIVSHAIKSYRPEHMLLYCTVQTHLASSLELSLTAGRVARRPPMSSGNSAATSKPVRGQCG